MIAEELMHRCYHRVVAYDNQIKSRVVALIRARYDQDDENAILRQRDTKPDEFAAYNTYVEDCKTKVRAEMEAERKDSEETENENSEDNPESTEA